MLSSPLNFVRSFSFLFFLVFLSVIKACSTLVRKPNRWVLHGGESDFLAFSPAKNYLMKKQTCINEAESAGRRISDFQPVVVHHYYSADLTIQSLMPLHQILFLNMINHIHLALRRSHSRLELHLITFLVYLASTATLLGSYLRLCKVTCMA